MAGVEYRPVMDLLNEKHVKQILEYYGDPELVSSEVKPAVKGLAGFLGDHFRLTLHVRVEGKIKQIKLFAKTMPLNNRARAEYIEKCNYFKREVFMFQLLDHLQPDKGANPWSTIGLIKESRLIVMPDLAAEGYMTCERTKPLQLRHVMLSVAALARYHAACANYHTAQQLVHHTSYHALQDHEHIFTEPTFTDTPWVRAAAKLTANFLKTFSDKYNSDTDELELALAKLNIEACESLAEYKDTLNVFIHKDLWINNVIFKYEDGVPTNALILDFQLVRYGPPAFDLTIFLYYCTSRRLRATHERQVFDYYYSVFEDNVDEPTKRRMEQLNYDKSAFLSWCEKARLFGMFEAVACGPQVWLEADVAQEIFDNPATFDKLVNEDRTEPLVLHARRCNHYKQWILEIFEEYVDTYIK